MFKRLFALCAILAAVKASPNPIVFDLSQQFSAPAASAPLFVVDPGIYTYFQLDGNLVVYNGDASGGNVIWSSGTGGRNCNKRTCRLNWQGDGNLVIYVDGSPVWASNTAQHGQKLYATSDTYALYIYGKQDGVQKVVWHARKVNPASPTGSDPGECTTPVCP